MARPRIARRNEEAYFKLAQGWHSLATHIEGELGLGRTAVRNNKFPIRNW